MGNNKISITAELVSIMRSESDPKNSYFASPKGYRLYNLTKAIISERKLKEIFSWRLNLSDKFNQKISKEKPEQIIDLAAGYSLRGLNLCLKNENLIYVDSDLPEVISRKKEILENLCDREKIILPKNYFLVPINALESNIFEKVKNLILPNKKTLITAEGLTSYFSENEFEIFIKNIKSFLNDFFNAEFYSHENISQPKGFAYKFLRSIFVSFLTMTKGRKGFANVEEFENFLQSLGIKFELDLSQEGFLFYSLFKD